MMADPSRERADYGEISPLGSVVVLLADSNDRLSAQAAIDLCSGLAGEGRRMVLADLHLETPLLHDLLGVDNLEGMVDIFLYGASLARIARPVLDSAFLFIPAGTYPSDPAEVYSNSRWKKLVAGFTESDATLAVFTPVEGSDLEALARWSSDIVLLGPASSREQLEELERLGYRVVETRPASIASAPTPALEQAEEVMIWPPAPPEGLTSPLAAPEIIRLPESELELPPPPLRTPPRSRGGSPVLWILLTALVIATLAYLLFSLRPDLLTGASTGSLSGAESGVGEAAAELPTALSRPVPYSVPVRAYSSLSAAQEEVSANQLRLPSVPFYVSPEVQQGVLYYRVFAGTLSDSAAAEVLRRDLVSEGIIREADSAGSWTFVEMTPMAFDLGEFASGGEATERLASFRADAIPAYATLIPYSDGTRRWQLYGGAFRDSVSAEGMRDLLTAGGVEPVLTVRSGLRRDAPPDAGSE